MASTRVMKPLSMPSCYTQTRLRDEACERRFFPPSPWKYPCTFVPSGTSASGPLPLCHFWFHLIYLAASLSAVLYRVTRLILFLSATLSFPLAIELVGNLVGVDHTQLAHHGQPGTRPDPFRSCERANFKIHKGVFALQQAEYMFAY